MPLATQGIPVGLGDEPIDMSKCDIGVAGREVPRREVTLHPGFVLRMYLRIRCHARPASGLKEMNRRRFAIRVCEEALASGATRPDAICRIMRSSSAAKGGFYDLEYRARLQVRVARARP